VGTIKISLAGVDPAKLSTRIGKHGIRLYKADLTIKMRLDDECGHLVFRALLGEEEVGRAGIEMSSS
jgi:predicted LPLAT superfamily acyltransferase